MTYEQAFALLRQYNSDSFHICHALTVSKVMRRMAQQLGYGGEADFWPSSACFMISTLSAGRRSTARNAWSSLSRAERMSG